MNIKSVFKRFIFGEDEPEEKKSGVYISAYSNWARIETNLPAEKNAQAKKAVDEIVKAVLSEGVE